MRCAAWGVLVAEACYFEADFLHGVVGAFYEDSVFRGGDALAVDGGLVGAPVGAAVLECRDHRRADGDEVVGVLAFELQVPAVRFVFEDPFEGGLGHVEHEGLGRAGRGVLGGEGFVGFGCVGGCGVGGCKVRVCEVG